MSTTESPAIARRLESIRRATGKPVILRGARSRNRLLRGRIVERPDTIVLEYRDDTAGYFWHYQIIEELLTHVENGRTNVVLYEGDIQYADASLQDIRGARASHR